MGSQQLSALCLPPYSLGLSLGDHSQDLILQCLLPRRNCCTWRAQQPCHSCLAPLSRHLLPRDMPKAGHRAEPHSFVGLYRFSWGMDAVDEEETSVLVKEFVSGGSGIHWDLELELCPDELVLKKTQ